MVHQSPLETVLELLEDHKPVPGATMDDKMAYAYLDAGHIDSFALVHFITDLEGRFDIVLDPEDTQGEAFRTVGGVADLIARKLAS